MKRMLILAGEESGELYARQIREAVLRADPSVEIRGYGDAGFEISDLAVMGILGVLRKIFFFMRVKRTMMRMIDEWRPDVVCTVDYPGMNLRLAAYAKSRGVRTVHVVCPQVWAWKRGRIPKIEASLDRLCCFFPFEPALFKPGLAKFVGHPLAWSWGKEEGRRKKEEGGMGRLLAVLPGSRIGEIRHHTATLMETVAKLKAEFPGLRVVVPAANEKAHRAILDEMSRSEAGDGVEVRLGGARDVLREADAAVVASGTATLEAALAGCPTVLVYKVDPVFAFLARRFIKGVRHIGLANIIAEKAGTECPMPELLQEGFTAEAVAGRIREWLADGEANASARRRLSETVASLRAGDDPIAEIARCL